MSQDGPKRPGPKSSKPGPFRRSREGRRAITGFVEHDVGDKFQALAGSHGMTIKDFAAAIILITTRTPPPAQQVYDAAAEIYQGELIRNSSGNTPTP